jgi:hypothetical protein
LALSCFASGRAAADEAEFGPYHRPANAGDEWDTEKGSRAMRLATGYFVHDGFYLRLAGGLGGISDKLNGAAHTSEGAAGQLDGTVSGFSGATEVAVGLTPFRGWVLGLAIDTLTMPSASGSLGADAGRFEFQTSQLATYGALVDYYLDPLRGFHVQASVGLASYIMGQGDSGSATIAPPHAALGFGFMLGVGNQWWIDRDWTLGVLPRLMLAWTNGVDEFGGAFSHRTIGYSLLLTATYH